MYFRVHLVLYLLVTKLCHWSKPSMDQCNTVDPLTPLSWLKGNDSQTQTMLSKQLKRLAEQALRCYLRQDLPSPGTKQVRFRMAPVPVQRSVKIKICILVKNKWNQLFQMRVMNVDNEKVTSPVSSAAAKRPSRKEKMRIREKGRPAHEVIFNKFWDLANSLIVFFFF